MSSPCQSALKRHVDAARQIQRGKNWQWKKFNCTSSWNKGEIGILNIDMLSKTADGWWKEVSVIRERNVRHCEWWIGCRMAQTVKEKTWNREWCSRKARDIKVRNTHKHLHGKLSKSLKRHARTSAKHVEGNMTGTLNLEMKKAGCL